MWAGLSCHHVVNPYMCLWQAVNWQPFSYQSCALPTKLLPPWSGYHLPGVRHPVGKRFEAPIFAICQRGHPDFASGYNYVGGGGLPKFYQSSERVTQMSPTFWRGTQISPTKIKKFAPPEIFFERPITRNTVQRTPFRKDFTLQFWFSRLVTLVSCRPFILYRHSLSIE